MALDPTPPPPSWERWPQPQQNSDYAMMDTPMMGYNSRPGPSATYQRPAMQPQFMMGAPYNSAPVHSMGAPQDHQAQSSMSFAGFSPHMGNPFKHPYHERPTMLLTTNQHEQSGIPNHQNHSLRRPSRMEGSRSPSARSESVKSEAQMSSTGSTTSSLSAAPKTVAPIIVQGLGATEFHTEIDTLMKVIQAKPEVESIVKKAEEEADFKVVVQPPPPPPPPELVEEGQQDADSKKELKFRCDLPGCTMACSQKTHLTIHKRSHTGEKPFKCLTCGHAFSQLGNLRTHERRHTGEKPYQCDLCGKHFAQRGNLRAHKKTHLKLKPFKCVFPDCNKDFTQRGNLKTHQNKFHAEDLSKLALRFRDCKDISKATPEDRALFEHFATTYKNSNKGIKGRGPNRKVVESRNSMSISPNSPHHAVSMHFAVQPVMPEHHLRQNHHHHHHHGLPSLPHHHSLTGLGLRPNMIMQVPRLTRSGYAVYDMDQDSNSSASTASELAFGDRIY